MTIEKNLLWDHATMPSEIIKQIYDQEKKSGRSTLHNQYALAFAYGKAMMLELLAKEK